MLIWEDDIAGGGKVAVLDAGIGPRSMKQLQALVVLTVGGVSREELDEFAMVSNSPALIYNLDRLGFRVGRRGKRTPGAIIWSGGGYPNSDPEDYQYALTPMGRRVMKELMRPGRRFRYGCCGFSSYFEALTSPERLFARFGQDWFKVLLRRNGYKNAAEVVA